MPPLSITTISNGLDLQNADWEIGDGFTKESVGIDYGTPGIVKPMRAASTVNTFGATKVDECIVYLGSNKYLFTTTASGLYVTDITSGFPLDQSSSTLINASFTGTFKALPINDQYVILANSTLIRKWVPGLSTTYQLGLNTPPAPTLTAGTEKIKTIDAMDSASGWSSSGGGVAGTISYDSGVKMEGTGSLRFYQRKWSTITASKKFTGSPINLSYFDTPGDLGIAFIRFSFLMDPVTDFESITLTFSCASDGNFDKDAYSLYISPSAMQSFALTQSSSNEDIYGDTIPGVYDPESSRAISYKIPMDSLSASTGDVLDYTSVVVSGKKTVKLAVSGSWVTVNAMQSEFSRIGNSTGRDWSTITGIRIAITTIKPASAAVQYSWVDSIYMVGGGNLWGVYYVAVAYQNAYGNYGPYSAFAGPVSVTGVPLTISGLTVDSDAQTTKRRIAIIGGSLTVPMVHILADNTTTSLSYNTKDVDLTLEETRWNNQKAPAGCRDIIHANGRIWLVGVPNYKNRLIYSEPTYYEAFPYSNYRILGEGEDLYQVAAVGEAIAARGASKEYLTYLLGESHLYWKTVEGAPHGAVSSRFLLKLSDSEHVYASRQGFYKSGPGQGFVLQKVGVAVADFTSVRGIQVGQFCYIAFQDTGGTYRLLRLDTRLGGILPHYVANINPAALYSDPVTKLAYYTVGASTYKIEGASSPLATKLVIPGKFAGTKELKSFCEMYYQLSGGPLSLTLVRDGSLDSSAISLADNTEEIVSLPENSVRSMGMILESTTQDFILTLPIVLEADLVS